MGRVTIRCSDAERTMAGRRLQNLERRGAVYYARLYVPADLQAAFGRRELRWSLRLKDGIRAADAVLIAVLSFRGICAKLKRMMVFTDDDLRRELRAYVLEMLAQSCHPPQMDADDSCGDSERLEQKDLTELAVDYLKAVIERELYGELGANTVRCSPLVGRDRG